MDGLDLGRILSEATPIATLLAGFGILAGAVFVLSVGFAGTAFGVALWFVTWLVAAVGTFVTLLYVVVRALQLAERERSSADRERSNEDGSESTH